MRWPQVIILAIVNMFLWSMPAHAFFAAVLGFLGGAGIGAVIKSVLINLVVSAITSKIFGKKSKKSKGARGASGVLVNKQSSNEPVDVVYGLRRTGGVRVFIGTSDGAGGAGTKYLNMALALCEGEMGNIKQVYFGQELVWDADGSGTTSGNATDGFELLNYEESKFTYDEDDAPGVYKLKPSGDDASKIVYHPGTTTQNADATLVASIEETWDTTYQLKGVAYLAMKLRADGAVYEGGLPTFTVVLEGKKIRDVDNLSATPTASADQNPADVLHDYLTSDIYGKGLADPDIDIASFQQAKTDCSGKYNINGILDPEDRIIDNIDKILNACNGMLVYSNGKYKLKIKKQNETHTKTFTTENIVSEMSVSLTDIKNRYNKITIDFGNGDDTVLFNDDVVIRENATYKTQDNNTTLEQTIEMPLTTSETEVETMGDFLLDQSRYGMTATFEVAHTQFGVEAGDIVRITMSQYGFTNKLFRVLTTELTENNTINIVAQEYESSIHP